MITNSLSAAAALFRTRHRVVLLGGELRNNSLDLIGPLAEKNLADFRIEWMISGCDAASADAGFCTADQNLSRLKQHLVGVAAHTAIITESAKFSRTPENCFAAPYQVDLLVTDTGLSSADASALRGSGMRLVMRDVSRGSTTWN